METRKSKIVTSGKNKTIQIFPIFKLKLEIQEILNKLYRKITSMICHDQVGQISPQFNSLPECRSHCMLLFFRSGKNSHSTPIRISDRYPKHHRWPDGHQEILVSNIGLRADSVKSLNIKFLN